ncbi:MAG: type II toxin-antitoxin system HicA family toxin [Pseudanabaena sp. CAN_BIN31]|nr:type II toxin-antitoxin system HicA family toxin [Pseudanabaena sp. CAN_BIN31]
MAKLPDLTSKELIAVLEKIGFQIMRQKGIHVRVKHNDGRIVTIPVHSVKTLGKGLLLKILRGADLTKEQLYRSIGVMMQSKTCLA